MRCTCGCEVFSDYREFRLAEIAFAQMLQYPYKLPVAPIGAILHLDFESFRAQLYAPQVRETWQTVKFRRACRHQVAYGVHINAVVDKLAQLNRYAALGDDFADANGAGADDLTDNKADALANAEVNIEEKVVDNMPITQVSVGTVAGTPVTKQSDDDSEPFFQDTAMEVAKPVDKAMGVTVASHRQVPSVQTVREGIVSQRVRMFDKIVKVPVVKDCPASRDDASFYGSLFGNSKAAGQGAVVDIEQAAADLAEAVRAAGAKDAEGEVAVPADQTAADILVSTPVAIARPLDLQEVRGHRVGKRRRVAVGGE